MGIILFGFVLLLIGAACGGSFGLPSKFVKKDTPWEVLWGPFFFFVAIVIPSIVAPLVVDDLFGVFAQVGFAKILPVLVFGLLWGLGSITLGKAFAFIGLSLAYALNYGAQIITGSVVPMAIHSPGEMAKSHGIVILAGVAVCVVGVIIAGRAAILKERSLKTEDDEPVADAKKSPKMLIGLIIGILSGILCACYSVGFSFADPVDKLIAASVKAGSTAAWAQAWGPTALILWGGSLSACGYSVWELTKHKTWGQLKGPGIGRTLVLAFAMAILHDAAVLFFGLGAIRIGDLGGSVGYAVFMSFGIIVGNFHGFRTGEWKGASPQSVKLIMIGLGVLILGVCILGAGKWMQISG